MTDLPTQLEWEETMILRGVYRYRNQQALAIEGDRAPDTSAGSRFLKNYVLQVADHIDAYMQGKLPSAEGTRTKHRVRSVWHKLIKGVNSDAAAMFTLRQLIGGAFSDQQRTVTSVCVQIGMRIEDELRFSKFQTEFMSYYDEVIRQMDAGFTKDYRHKHRVLAHLSQQKGMEWRTWSNEERFQVGRLLVTLTMEVCDLVKVVKINRAAYIVPTAACLEWIEKHDLIMELASPDRLPLLIKPSTWVDPFEGGYWGPRMRHMTPLVKGTAERPSRRAHFESVEMPRVLSSINGMQDTEWRVNKEVLDIMRRAYELNLPLGMPQSEPYAIPPCPLADDEDVKILSDSDPRKEAFANWKVEARELHNMEADRVAKLRALVRTTRIAGEMRDKDRLYYAYQCDFRGRVYCAASGLSPQGTDQSKSLLTFGRTEPLGFRGFDWLKVHGANKFGYDKVSFAHRVQWVDSQHAKWLALAKDPIGMRDEWAGCYKPWQFLAWAFEYSRASNAGADYRSSLPVALDGSCNGLQHFSAMLRDPVGGRAVNLVPGPVPADIYQEVADVCTRRLRGMAVLPDKQHTAASNWLALFSDLHLEGMPRDLSKKPVMTLPYGSTQTSCTQSIFQWIHEKAPMFFPAKTNFVHAAYLSPILWDSISEVVVAARQAMIWIQDCSSILSKRNQPLQYTSPLGFPVLQKQQRINVHRIETQIDGELRLNLGTETDKLDVRRQRQGSSPNLVHSVDAAHMMMCVNDGLDLGMDSFAMIHDDFGVHACHVDDWQKVIRQTFVELHEEHDILADFKETHEIRHEIALPALPPQGTLNLREVLQSPYFFG